MPRTELARLLRASEKAAIQDALALLDGPARVVDSGGKVLFGPADLDGEEAPIEVDGDALGTVIAPQGAPVLARLVGNLAGRARERRTLAAETLDRYKELTLLYDMSDDLAKMLELADVAEHVVKQATTHLRADTVILFLASPAGALQGIACTGGDCHLKEPDALAVRVYRDGQADLLEDAGTSRMSAPLRHGEDVFGVLFAMRAGGQAWTAGDLKLMSAMASNSGSAVRKAQLHQHHVREMALRHKVQRHISPELPDAVFSGSDAAGEEIAVLFCDLRATAGADTEGADPDALIESIERALGASLQVLMRHGATVDLPLGEILLGVFWDRTGLSSTADHAVSCAGELYTALQPSERVSIGIASGPVATEVAESLHGVIHEASLLHNRANGRVLVDAAIQAALPDRWTCTAEDDSAFEVALR